MSRITSRVLTLALSQTLLSEYGFILPSSSPDRLPDGIAWDGNPYAEVNVDHIIDRYLAKETDDWGQKKVLLLHEHGYHGDYTIHPSPSPVHPSHRLVVVLRLIAIKQQAKRRSRPQAGKVKKQKLADDGRDDEARQVRAWEETINGQRDIVSAENEAAVCDLLLCICDEIISNSKDRQAEHHLFEEPSRDVHDNGVKEADLPASITLVMNLLQEEERIAQSMKEAVRKGLIDW